MSIDINKQQVDIENLFKQNVNDLASIKELYKRIEELGEKITQIKYIDSTLAKKLKKEYESLKRIILDENTQIELSNKIDSINGNINEINSELNNNTQLIKQVSNANRIFQPKVYAYLSQGDSGSIVWETYVDEITYREHLTAMKNGGCDGFVLCLQIQPSKEQRDNLNSGTITEDELVYRAYPSFENVQLLKNLGDRIGVPLVGIKFHNNWIRDNYNALTFSKWIEQYTQEVYRFANEFTEIKYISILNESKTIINTNSNKSKIKTLLDQLKKKGFITGFSGVNDFDNDYNNYVNGIFIHTYPTISNKGKNTIYQDGIIGWESYGILETLKTMRKKFPDKTFLISETGVQNYWNALSLPEQNFNENNTIVDDGSPSAIYFYGMFETLKNDNYNFLDSVWLFYTNPIREKTQKIIFKYTHGGAK